MNNNLNTFHSGITFIGYIYYIIYIYIYINISGLIYILQYSILHQRKLVKDRR